MSKLIVRFTEAETQLRKASQAVIKAPGAALAEVQRAYQSLERTTKAAEKRARARLGSAEQPDLPPYAVAWHPLDSPANSPVNRVVRAYEDGRRKGRFTDPSSPEANTWLLECGFTEEVHA